MDLICMRSYLIRAVHIEMNGRSWHCFAGMTECYMQNQCHKEGTKKKKRYVIVFSFLVRRETKKPTHFPK